MHGRFGAQLLLRLPSTWVTVYSFSLMMICWTDISNFENHEKRKNKSRRWRIRTRRPSSRVAPAARHHTECHENQPQSTLCVGPWRSWGSVRHRILPATCWLLPMPPCCTSSSQWNQHQSNLRNGTWHYSSRRKCHENRCRQPSLQ